MGFLAMSMGLSTLRHEITFKFVLESTRKLNCRLLFSNGHILQTTKCYVWIMNLVRNDQCPTTSCPAEWVSSPCPWGGQLCVMHNFQNCLGEYRDFGLHDFGFCCSVAIISIARSVLSKLWIWLAMNNGHQPAVRFLPTTRSRTDILLE